MITQRVDSEHDVLGFATDWVRELAMNVDRLTVLTGYEGSHDLPENVKVVSYGKELGLKKGRRIAAFQRHCFNLTGRIDVVFVHMIPKYVLASYPIFWPTGVPFVLWYAHSSVTWDLRLAEQLVDCVVTPSVESFRLDSQKLEVVGHGIDTDRFSPGNPETDRNSLLALGRIDPVKRIETLTDAVDKLVTKGRNIRFRVVGEPSEAARGSGYLDSLRGRINDAGLKNHVTFAGRVPHYKIASEYRQAGVFINDSNTGSLDKVEIEALACGTPVISSNDSYQQMISESHLNTDLLTFCAGDTDSLVDYIENILHLDPDAYQALGHQARNIVVKKHDVNKTMSRITDLLAAHVD
jgi:glycosyltransferase involved in cell wall biosynthesis